MSRWVCENDGQVMELAGSFPEHGPINRCAQCGQAMRLIPTGAAEEQPAADYTMISPNAMAQLLAESLPLAEVLLAKAKNLCQGRLTVRVPLAFALAMATVCRKTSAGWRADELLKVADDVVKNLK